MKEETYTVKLSWVQLMIVEIALHEYTSHRQTPRVEDYVKGNYSAPRFGKKWMEEKTADVKAKVKMAQELHQELCRKKPDKTP